MILKTSLPLVGLLVLLALGAALAVGPSTAVALETKTNTFAVKGMTCGGCEVGVRMAVGKLSGIQKVEASYVDGKAVVTYEPSKVSPKEIISAIEKLGYEARLVEKTPTGSQ